MSHLSPLTAEPLFTLEPAVRYADALQRYNTHITRLIEDIVIGCELDSEQRDAFVEVFGEYRKAIVDDDSKRTIEGEAAVFALAEQYGIPTGMNFPFYSAVLDFSFFVQLLSEVEKECVVKFSLAQ